MKKQGTDFDTKTALSVESCSRCETETAYVDLSDGEPAMGKPALLLHSCCGPCSTACIERLLGDYAVTVFYYNPNIDDREEYERRRKTQMEFLSQWNEEHPAESQVGFLSAPYDPERFLEEVAGLEEEPEGGRRCAVCFRMRLEKTAETASLMHFDVFATTLTVSPHKDYDTISEIGRRLGLQYGVSYLDANFKKKDGYRRSIELSKAYRLYRQNFCGCRFSRWEGCDETTE